MSNAGSPVVATDLPTVVTIVGLLPQTPTALNAELIALVTSTNPDYTANLPGALVEDISSTATGALVIIDGIRVEFFNSLTPYGCNEFLLNQFGQIYGVPQGLGFNTSVYISAYDSTPGFVIEQGFIATDGTFQYVVQDQTAVGADGTSPPIYCVATVGGTWPVPPNTVTGAVTQVPGAITLNFTNPSAGIPSQGAQSSTSYRSDVLQAGLVASTGMARALKTLLRNIPGVEANLVSAVPQEGGGWIIVVGPGGDPYAIANAIYKAVPDISTLKSSVINVESYTKADPGVITTDLNHGLINGQTATVSGASPSTYDSTGVVTVISPTEFSLALNTTGFGTYTGGGVVTPNNRNVTASLYDYPDTYEIPFVVPPAQIVAMDVTWDTISTNVVSNSAMQQAAATPLAAYVSAIATGQPINVLQLEETFIASVSGILPAELITTLTFTVSINGIGVSPEVGTKIIVGDPLSYFSCTADAVSISQA